VGASPSLTPLRHISTLPTPAFRDASSASFDMIGFRLVDHDGREFLAGQEPSSSTWPRSFLGVVQGPQEALGGVQFLSGD
jgi:hypothetical protein